MPADPRFSFYWDELDGHMSSASSDGTINLPTFTTQGFTQSTSIGLSCTFVNANTAAPQVGLGAANGELAGKIKQVAADGTVTFQDRGYMTFVNTGAAPATNAPIGVDGTGKVQSTAANKQAFFVGVVVNPATGTNVWVVRKI